MYYTYMIRCKDNSIYTGYTNDLVNRFNTHSLKKKQGAKYTKSHEAIRLEAAWRTKNKSMACKLEYYIKTLTKSEKEELINKSKIAKFFSRKN